MSPSVGNKKSSVDVDLRIVAPEIPLDFYYAFSMVLTYDGIQPSIYDSGGQWVSDRCAPLAVDYGTLNITGVGLLGHWTLISHDPEGIAGDGSIAAFGAAGELVVVDANAATVLVNSIADPGYNLRAGLGFKDGWVYWVEQGSLGTLGGFPTSVPTRLRRCRLDGSSIGTLRYILTPFFGGGLNFVSMTNDSVLCYISNPGSGDTRSARFTLDGTAGDIDSVPPSEGVTGAMAPGLAISTGSGFIAHKTASPARTGFVVSDVLAFTASDLFPSGWTSGLNLLATQASVNAAGSEALIYTVSGTGAVGAPGELVRNSVTVISGSPQTSLIVDVHPTIGFRPDAMFFAS